MRRPLASRSVTTPTPSSPAGYTQLSASLWSPLSASTRSPPRRTRGASRRPAGARRRGASTRRPAQPAPTRAEADAQANRGAQRSITRRDSLQVSGSRSARAAGHRSTCGHDPLCAARRAPTSAETEWARDLLATESAPPDTAAGLPRVPRKAGHATSSATRCASEHEGGSGAGRSVPGRARLLHASSSGARVDPAVTARVVAAAQP
jgi:hypothetical protein